MGSHSEVGGAVPPQITGMCHYPQLIFVFFVEKGIYHVAQVDFKLLGSGDLPTLASQSAGNTGMSHHASKRCLSSRNQYKSSGN